MSTLLEVSNLKKHFAAPRAFARGMARRVQAATTPAAAEAAAAPAISAVRAVDGVSFAVQEGTTLGLVGESGCGKSTTAQLLLRLIDPTEGEIRFAGERVDTLKGKALRPYRASVQAVFQNPYSALNPRMRVRDIIGEPLVAAGSYSKTQIADRVKELLSVVGLRPTAADQFPHEFSGGQRQRVAIARGLSLQPKLLILDEPVSALDVSIRAQILNLLQDLQEKFHLSYLLISHDLEIVAHMCDQIAVMYLGRIVEIGPASLVAGSPMHPYTEALFSATLPADPDERGKRIKLIGEIPSAMNPPSGCPFHTRCPVARPNCSTEVPPLKQHGDERYAACHYAGVSVPA